MHNVPTASGAGFFRNQRENRLKEDEETNAREELITSAIEMLKKPPCAGSVPPAD